MAIPCELCELPALVGADGLMDPEWSALPLIHPECYEQRKMGDFRQVLRDHPAAFEMLGPS